ncbi:hypothetical protein Acr_15g0016320 [Actinidia rufa]|uniref:Uncharacterized protein n=1 Tax=Actinidia rufa TaxID=165716 RepID=A0A7J0FWR4_9ERIC|nr:hypothetical protein Acr_15g0016320 [Actinidia rufa]
MERTKHASNDPRGDDPNPVESKMGDGADEEEDGDKGMSHREMDIEENLELPPSIRWQDDETVDEEVPMQRVSPMHGGHPPQEGTSTQGGPPALEV